MKFLSIFANAVTALEYQTDEASCINCYANGAINCINKDFSYSQCCDYDQYENQKKCMEPFEFCTYNLKESVYKVFTCPLFGCQNQNTAVIVQHNTYDKEITSFVEWGYFENAYNCKIIVGADPILNGSLTAEVEV